MDRIVKPNSCLPQGTAPPHRIERDRRKAHRMALWGPLPLGSPEIAGPPVHMGEGDEEREQESDEETCGREEWGEENEQRNDEDGSKQEQAGARERDRAAAA